MLKIRLRRVGKRNQPSYRVVVVEHTQKSQGSYLEALGSYNPRAGIFAVKQDRVLYWLDNGAQPSERMAKLLTSINLKHKLISLPDYNRKPKRAPKKTAPETPQKEATPTSDKPSSETKTSDETSATNNVEGASSDTSVTQGGSTPEAATQEAAAEQPAENSKD